MATLLRSVSKVNNKVSRLSHLYRISVKPKIAQPTCFIFTSNKKKDAVTIPVSEKDGKEVEKLDNLLENDEVCCASLKSKLSGKLSAALSQNFSTRILRPALTLSITISLAITISLTLTLTLTSVVTVIETGTETAVFC